MLVTNIFSFSHNVFRTFVLRVVKPRNRVVIVSTPFPRAYVFENLNHRVYGFFLDFIFHTTTNQINWFNAFYQESLLTQSTCNRLLERRITYFTSPASPYSFRVIFTGFISPSPSPPWLSG